jgi:ATPase subunit of ABC transporter with duplicated ATPase domains
LLQYYSVLFSIIVVCFSGLPPRGLLTLVFGFVVDVQCKKGERVGLVGINGCGKTTQLQIIIGKMEADSGNVIMAPRAEVAYLTQVLPDVTPASEDKSETNSKLSCETKRETKIIVRSGMRKSPSRRQHIETET